MSARNNFDAVCAIVVGLVAFGFFLGCSAFVATMFALTLAFGSDGQHIKPWIVTASYVAGVCAVVLPVLIGAVLTAKRKESGT